MSTKFYNENFNEKFPRKIFDNACNRFKNFYIDKRLAMMDQSAKTFSMTPPLQTLLRDHPYGRSLFVGVAGWSYPDWNNLIYPPRRPKDFSELACLSALFNVAEISTTYYHPQSTGAAAAWLRQVASNPRFRFTAKLWQKFTLEKVQDGGAGYSKPDIEIAQRGMRPLLEAGRLGALLVQFPQSFHYNARNRDRVSRLLEAFQEYPLVLETRHDSWNHPEALAMLHQRGAGFANIDQPQIGHALGFTEIISGRLAYFRFHGRNDAQWLNKDAGVDQRYDYLYSAAELERFAAAIRTAVRQTESTYVIFNNHPAGQAVVNALQLQFSLTGVKVQVPENLLKAYPALGQVRQGANPRQIDLF
jgi:uncharacterized protein YecE (DUF72 family)